MIQAVILAGGLGQRLRPLTEDVPKPLLPIHGKPFLQYQLEHLKACGMAEVVLLTGYLGWRFEEHFGDGSGLGLRISYVREETPLGTGGALRNAAEWLAEEFLLLNGDTLLPIDYAALVAAFRKLSQLGMLVAFEDSQEDGPNNLRLGAHGQVLAYSKHDATGMTHVDAGVAIFRRAILDWIPRGQVVSLEEEVYPRLIEQRRLWAFPTRERFIDMGTFAGLQALGAVLEAGRRR